MSLATAVIGMRIFVPVDGMDAEVLECEVADLVSHLRRKFEE